MSGVAQPHPDLNMANILTRNNMDDFYGALGADPNSTREQIVAEFKARVRGVHPDRQQTSQDEGQHAAEQFARLHRAYEVLSDPESRAKYDRYLAAGLNLSYDTWLDMQQHQRVMHWAIPKKKPTLDQEPFRPPPQ
ncbi:DnaJ domain containing protein [Acanthamoeba castellanii str. Neff]|uniref:DnaJ domain containing protein n=1 Tax=Acanthamoeba castellanii (strain ATCC 30010 / Neff) TaxID=1257118 RepID=L8GNQ9_ACACF|nr:DnaJ domain containing protein [Acanthamoeba castellanii str. Neff]ELR14524.1 DnaJ domain containing protein [Acanthamoeba castellanii str. Neff]